MATAKKNAAEAKGRASARILIVDDHPLVRRGLRELIGPEPELEVCSEAADAAEAIRQVDRQCPDLVIVDLSLKSGHGLELIQKIKDRGRGTKMLVSSMHDESLYAERALRAGAMGYICKQEDPDRVLEAIWQVLHGRTYLSAAMTEHLIGWMFRGGEASAEQFVNSLSNRELEVFELIGQGKMTRQISETLHLSVKTIETYRENIKRKLNLKTAAELSRCAVLWVLEDH